MGDTISLPIAGEVKKTWVYVGGAVVAGVVGYAWYAHRQNTAAAAGTAPEDLVDYGGGVQTAAAGTTTPGLANGNTSTDTTDPSTLPPTTNAAWFNRVVDYMGGIGYDPTVVASALGKYLAREGLTPAEADLVRVAVGALGTPPVGEFRIIPIGTPSTPIPPAPTPTPVPTPTPKPAPAPVYYSVTVVRYTSSHPPWNSTISGIASHYGYGSNWQAVWNDAKNKPLRDKRKSPNLIRAGDIVYVKKK
jgi:hypothetical protein